MAGLLHSLDESILHNISTADLSPILPGNVSPCFLFSALIFWQSFLFLKVHRRFCMRLGLVDNTHLGMAKPRAAPVTWTRALPRECLIYLFHALTLAMAAIFSMPIHVS